MLVKTRGLVFSYLKYRESSIIARVYTERLGLQSYVVNGVRRAKPPGRIALFQPLTLLELVAYTSPRGGLTRLAEFRCAEPYATLPYDVAKSSVALFLAEVLGRAVREEEPNEALFHFLHDALLTFDRQGAGSENFALQFLLHLAGFLGFGVESAAELLDQVALAGNAPVGSRAASAPPVLRLKEFETYLDELLQEAPHSSIPNGRVRRELLGVVLRYYQLHVEQLGDIRSLDILSEVLAG